MITIMRVIMKTMRDVEECLKRVNKILEFLRKAPGIFSGKFLQ